MGKKPPKTPYQDYHLSWQHGFCHGPVDELKQVWFNEKELLEDDDILLDNGMRKIDKPDLFGGFEREGGVEGDMHWMRGTHTQKIPQAMASRVGKSPDDYPGFRGLASLFFCGNDDTDRPGMRVASNNPRAPVVWARMFRACVGLPGNNGVIVQDDGYKNVNPAHMLFEVLTNQSWGMGGSLLLINNDSFQEAAATLFDEDFGLSMLWERQGTVETFIQEICDHVQGMVFFNPFTGLVHFKLVRGDYDKNSLPEIGPDTATLIQFRRPLWGETVNEITVSYTRPKTEQEETITFQDLGNISMQGEVVAETRNYYGIRNRKLAKFVGERDITAAATPLVTAQIKVNRREWNHLPGDVIRFTWPAHGVVRMAMRVMAIDWGRYDNALITVDLMEDVYALEYAEFGPPQEETWTDPKQDPDGTNMENLPVKWVAPPYSAVQWIADFYNFNLGDEYYPQIMISALVSPLPKAFDDNGNALPHQEDVQSFIMNVPDVMPNGDPIWTSAGEKTLTGRAKLIDTIEPAISSIIEFEDRYGGNGPKEGGIGILGTEVSDEFGEEWVLFTQRLSSTRWRVQRAIFDTIPRTWGVGTIVWFLGPEANIWDPTERLAGNNELYKLQPRTSAGIRQLSLTPILSTNRPDRLYRPYRPANCRVDGVMFGTADHSQRQLGGSFTGDGDDYDHEPREFLINVSWSNRHRAMEDTIFRRWDEANVAPEAGQTTEILIIPGHDRRPIGDLDDAQMTGEINRITGLTGTSHQFDIKSYTGQLTKMSLVFVSRRNGLVSLQGMTVNLWLYFKGYGYDWGWMYSGWPDGPILTSIDDTAKPVLMKGFQTAGLLEIEQAIIAKTRVVRTPTAGIQPWARMKGFRTRTGVFGQPGSAMDTNGED